MATAWLSLVLMCTALMIGPLRRIDGRPSPISMYRRRDLGIWAALIGLVHFVAGNAVAMNERYLSLFVRDAVLAPSQSAREAIFSGSSILGTVVGVVFVLLLAISSDWAMHRLGPRLWKSLQRSALFAFWLTVAHGVGFQVLEGRILPLLILVAAALVVVSFRSRARRGRLRLQSAD